MPFRNLLSPAMLLVFVFMSTDQTLAARRNYTNQGLQPAAAKQGTPKTQNSNKEGKSFDELTKDKVVIEGLFTFYHDTVDNSVLMAVRPEQFGPIYLCGETVAGSDGNFTDNGSMRETFPFYLKQVGKNILFLEKNLRLRADSASNVQEALAAGMSDFLVASAEIKCKPHEETGAVVIDPAELFIRDAENLSYFTGSLGKTGHNFDAKNSYFELVKSFPQNTEIDVKLHYKTNKPQSGTTLQNGYDFFHTYHYSLSTLPETDYVPRLADDRIGYFMTIYEDYTNIENETPYVRYIDRWNLKKKDPYAALSEPVEPIVFWIENTVPEVYRSAIAEGIEFWQPAFEKIGFKNAIIAKQMPDTASWDPADVRYSTVQWMINPGQSYAVGPHRSNPFTGQIYDADIRISADWIRYMYNIMENYIEPVSYDGSTPGDKEFAHTFADAFENIPYGCGYQREAAREAALDLAYLIGTAGELVDKDSLMKAYVHEYLVEVIAHEVGHTLGLRHNFKASTIYTLDQINDPEFTRTHAATGSIMDYMSANIAGPEQKQGDFYSHIPGPWDDWMIEYGYSDFNAATPGEEKVKLEAIAAKSTRPELVFATDEDTFGWSSKKTDPYSNQHDLGDDPLRFAMHKITQTKKLWYEAIGQFEQPGARYTKLRDVFQTGWRSFRELAMIAPQYIGGIEVFRDHIGTNGKKPFVLVSAAEQRRALDMLSEYLFASDAFDIPNDLHNKLQSERLPNFSGSSFSLPQLDYPFHQMVLSMQVTALNKLYSHYTLGRLLNNQVRYGESDDRFDMFELFQTVRRSIWSEVVKPEDVNSFRRQLQLTHLNIIIDIYLSEMSKYPADARTLAANDLALLYDAAGKAVNSSAVGSMTKAHFREVIRQIESARTAQRTFLK
ncbi:MAG: zinc-dependent metalloprotease [Candidatus Zixiibacteriota bacterium]